MIVRQTNMINTRAVTSQPIGFTAEHLDEDSQSIYNNLTTKHKTAPKLIEKTHRAGTQLMADVRSKVSPMGHISYQEFFQVGISKEERLLSSDHLAFESLKIYDENFKENDIKRGGRAVLTDTSILLMSSEYNESFTLSENGYRMLPAGSYKVSLECLNSSYYLPLPLHLFRSIEVTESAKVSASIYINKDVSLCKALLCKGCCGLCGPEDTWVTREKNVFEHNDTYITFGILLPPWGKKSFLRLYLGTDIQIANIYKTLALYQEAMPNVK